ncbi:hypothetical protein Tco_0156623 [Tanacetum coccineum]
MVQAADQVMMHNFFIGDDDADIRPIYDEEPMVEVPNDAEFNILAKDITAYGGNPNSIMKVSESSNSSKKMQRFSSNDIVHNHYLKEAKKKIYERGRNSKPSVMPSAKSQSTSNGSKPKPRSNTQTSRNWPASKNSFVTTKTMPIVEHSRNSRNFSDSKHFV